MKKSIAKVLFVILSVFYGGKPLMGQIQLNANTVEASAEVENKLNKPYVMYFFPMDSIQGFDENAAKQDALNRGCFGIEYHYYMYWAKRTYINNKYGLNPYNYSNPNGGGSELSYGSKPIFTQTNVINAAPCINEDFEASPAQTCLTAACAVSNTLAGWQVSQGQNSGANGSCLQTGCCPTAGSGICWVRQTPWTAPAPLGVIGASPFGGNKVLQIGDNNWGGQVVRVQQTFPVTSSNSLFRIAYRAALEAGHACCDQPYLRIEILNCNNQVLACPQVSVVPPGASCAMASPVGWATSGWVSYTPNWQIRSLDLTPYIGSCVTIRISCGDCPYSGHYGYAFIDCQCLPMTVTVNNIQFPSGSPIVAVAACGVTTASMTAPAGLGPYSWTGPAGSGINNNPNQTITTTMPGNYTLVMNPAGVCAPITKTVNLQFGQFPNAGFTTANSCTTYSLTNTGTQAPSVQSYSFNGPGAPVSYTTTNATSVVNFAPSTTYTIWQTVTNPQNCPATFSMVITTPPGPSPAFSTPNFTQCLTGNSFVFTPAVAAGSHTYAFFPGPGSPPTGFSSTYGPVNFTAPGNYTVVHTLNNSGCIVSTSSVVVINTLPNATATAVPPLCIGSSASLTGVGGPGVLSWTGPNGYTGNGPNATVPNFQQVNAGIYTLTVNNFGCIATKTVLVNAPAGPTVNVTNNGPICVGSPLVLSATWTSNINPSYFYWYTYKPTPYFYHYGGYNVASPTIAVTTTNNAQTYSFQISFGGGCPVQIYTTTVQMVNLNTPTVTNTGPYCPGANIQLNANVATATSYTWSGPSSFSSTTQNPSIPNASAINGGVYTLTTAIGNCKKSASTTVSIHPVPNPIAGSNSPVCLGFNINLTANAANSYTWTGPNAFTSSLQNPVIANANPSMAGTYTLKVTNAQGCVGTTTLNVTVVSPTTTASNNGPLCEGATLTFSTNAATSYAWSGPNGFTSLNQNPSIVNAAVNHSGTYTILATVGTCTALATTVVSIHPLPTPTASNTGPYCQNQNIQLNVNAFNTYTWSGPNSFASNNQNPSIATSSLVNAGSYVVVVTDANGCVNSSTTNVVVNPLPVIVVNNPTVCTNDDILLTATGGTSFAWTGPNSFTSSVQNPTISLANSSMNGNYAVTVTNGFGCVNNAVAVVSVVPLPTVTVAGTNTLCSQNLNGSPNSVVITGSGANSYAWTLPVGYIASPGNNLPSFTLFPPLVTSQAVAQLSVTGTGVFGCTNTAVYDVTVVPNPTIVPAPATSSICEGTSISLSVSGASSYTWSPSSSLNTNQGSSVIASPSVTTIYSIIGSNQGCNSATENATLQVVPNPTVTIMPATPTVCLGQSITLNAFGATDYTWTPVTALNTTTGSAVISTPNVNLTYSVLGSQNTCTNIAAVTVTVYNLPTINVALSSPTMCMNNFNGSPNSITLTAQGAISYTWGAFVGMTANQTTGASIIGTSALQSTIFSGTVTGFDGNCRNSAPFNAMAIDNPIVSVVSSSMCEGTSAVLTASGADSYSWSPIATLSSGTGSLVTANPNVTTVYSVYGSSLGCNSASQTGTVTVVPNPIITIAPLTPTICEGGSIALNAFGATDYTWSPASSLNTANGSVVIASPLSTIDYTVVGSAATCTSMAIRQVSVIALPDLFAASSKTALCHGEKTTINANGSMSYTWSPIYGIDNPNGNFVVASPTISTTYTIYGMNGICAAQIEFPIVVMPNPVLELSTNPQKVCQGTSTSLFASGAQTYSFLPNVNMTPITPNVVSITPSVTTNYTVMGMNASGTVVCMMTKEIMVEVIPTITASISNSVSICKGESVRLFAGGSNTYRWAPPTGLNNPNIQNPYASPNQTTEYTVRVSNDGFCGTTATVLVHVKPYPEVDAGPDMTYNSDEPMYLNAKGTGTLTWIYGDKILCKDCPNTQIMPENSGCYVIQAVNQHGCKVTDEVCIEVTKFHNIYIPNVFTPNYDGLNDEFLVYGTGIKQLEMIIFDRWGEKLFTSTDQLKGWNGWFKNEECKQDVYTYLINYTTLDNKKHTRTGHVTLMK